jgi:hypothetical protein
MQPRSDIDDLPNATGPIKRRSAKPELLTWPKPEGCQVPNLWENATARDGQLLFEPTQVFKGYVVDPQYPLYVGDDAVTLFVKTFDSTSITGAIVFGSGELPPIATDPLRAYLPPNAYLPDYPDIPPDTMPPRPWGGYALSLVNGTVEGTRVRFTVHAAEQWRTWCELLAGYPNGLCVPTPYIDNLGEGGYPGTSSECEGLECRLDGVHFDCAKLGLCVGVGANGTEGAYCTCEGCGCTASVSSLHLAFDFQLRDNGALEGVVGVAGDAVRHSVYLTPQAD